MPVARHEFERGLQQRECAEHVGLQESAGIDDGTIDMGLGGEMQHAREAVLVEQALHQRGIADVALDEGDLAAADQRLQAADVGGIGHGVDHDQAVGGSRRAPGMHQILADETGASGDQNAVHARPLLVGRLSAPIPKFALYRGGLVCELRNQRSTDNRSILVRLWL